MIKPRICRHHLFLYHLVAEMIADSGEMVVEIVVDSGEMVAEKVVDSKETGAEMLPVRLGGGSTRAVGVLGCRYVLVVRSIRNASANSRHRICYSHCCVRNSRKIAKLERANT
jgi:hypothetical protein